MKSYDLTKNGCLVDWQVGSIGRKKGIYPQFWLVLWLQTPGNGVVSKQQIDPNRRKTSFFGGRYFLSRADVLCLQLHSVPIVVSDIV
jgi:hypothetical protein